MNSFSTLREQLVETLGARLAGDGIAVVGEFPATQRSAASACLAVGLGGVELPGAPTGGGDLARLTLRFDLRCPVAKNAIGCHTAFDRLCDALLALRTTGGPGFGSITCGEIEYDRAQGAMLLTARATLDTMVMQDAAPEADVAPLTGVIFQTKGVRTE